MKLEQFDSRNAFIQSKVDNIELAKKLHISPENVADLRNGTIFPSLDLLTKINQIEGNESVKTLKKVGKKIIPFRIGNRISLTRVLLVILVIFFVSELLTGFGYQPFWLFAIVFLIGLVFVLPTCFNSYWIVTDKSLILNSFHKNSLIKAAQLIGLEKGEVTTIKYEEINEVAVIYKSKKRLSPFDFTGDYFTLKIELKNGTNTVVTVDNNLKDNLLEFIYFLNSKNICVLDSQHILDLIEAGENLFDYFSTNNEMN
ncbi:hypothetical protein BSQ38_01035 [Pediococcus damnosus]|uniref:helix-turn-helix domain-containing protein n=1 Tax=Pediococcus damnosus TaxID=51663 RepID=UPI000C1C935D|nr:helix-turn-helix transcriptional regulator [Pediococcus damnosus]PIO80345.1 hypothetical protein BSQ38_01035 [Pediococcus damnosus]